VALAHAVRGDGHRRAERGAWVGQGIAHLADPGAEGRHRLLAAFFVRGHAAPVVGNQERWHICSPWFRKLLLPHGSAHLMQDRDDSPAPPLDRILAERSLAWGSDAAERLAYGGDGPRTSLLCGGFASPTWPARSTCRARRSLRGSASSSASPPMGYLARVRLGHAAGYLSATDKTVRQIAHMVGYENESSLSKAFRRAFGRAPGENRRQQADAHGVRATFTG